MNGGTSHQAPGENVDVNRRQQQANLSSIPEGAEAEGEDDEDAMVGPVLPKARKRRVSSLGVLPSILQSIPLLGLGQLQSWTYRPNFQAHCSQEITGS